MAGTAPHPQKPRKSPEKAQQKLVHESGAAEKARQKLDPEPAVAKQAQREIGKSSTKARSREWPGGVGGRVGVGRAGRGWGCGCHKKSLDKDLLSTRFAEDVVAGQASSSNIIVPFDARKVSKVEAKLQIITDGVRSACSTFETDLWQQMKESSLSKFVTALSSYNTEAGTEGDQAAMDLSSAWLRGSHRAKKFLKLYREYEKVAPKHKAAKMADLIEPLLATHNFLVNTMKLTVGPSFKLLWLRAIYLERFTESKSISHSLVQLLQNDMAAVLQSASPCMAEEERPQFPQTWLRGLLFACVAELLESKNVVLKDLASDVGSAVKEMLDDDRVAVPFSEFIADLQALELIVVADESLDVSAVKLNAAIKRLEHPKLMFFQTLVEENTVWTDALVQASSVLKLSAKDTLADEKLTRAKAILADPRMPGLEVCQQGEGGDPTVAASVSNFHTIADLSVLGHLEDSIALVAEGMKNWSPMGCADKCNEVNAWLVSLLRAMAWVDECLCLYLQAWTAQHDIEQIGRAGLVSTGNIFGWPQASLLRILSTGISDHVIDETPFMELIEMVSILIEGAPTNVKAGIDVKHANAITSTILANILRRRDISDILKLLVDITDAPSSPKEALDEWCARRLLNKCENAFVSKAIRLVSSCAALGDNNFQFGDDLNDDEIVLHLDGGENRVRFVASLQGVPRHMSVL